MGIGDLVFASTYWSLPTRQQNEYSQYMQNFNAEVRGNFLPTGSPGTQEGITCITTRPNARRPYFQLQAAAADLRVPHQSGALVG